MPLQKVRGGFVRLLVLSDIHANLEALEAALAAAPVYDGVANLGDVVGYGACPNEVVDRARSLGEIFVRVDRSPIPPGPTCNSSTARRATKTNTFSALRWQRSLSSRVPSR